MPQPIEMTRPTPAARARASASDASPFRASRCACVSITSGRGRCRSLHPLELLPHNRIGIELLEERLRLSDALPRRQSARRPSSCERVVVAGQDLVRIVVCLGEGFEEKRSSELVLVAEQVMELLRAEREERREQDLEIV